MNYIRCLAVAVLVCTVSACALSARSTVRAGSPAPHMSDLWAEPDAGRDLFGGPGGHNAAPDPRAEYRFLARDVTGKSGGYDVLGPDGRTWSVKLGVEAQPEVVVSRLLWAAGYFQPATYYLPNWNLVGTSDPNPQPPGRFRLEADGEQRVGRWSWSANPFVGTTPLRGLFVLMVMVNNWDLKTQQNPLYELTGDDAGPLRRYAVRDLGASLGGTRWFLPGSKSNVEDLTSSRNASSSPSTTARCGFTIAGPGGSRASSGGVSAADVRWIAERLARLSPAQWSDAFSAAGYSESDTQRYVQRLRQKVDDGLNVERGP